jgi:LAO/AO transport system kinase
VIEEFEHQTKENGWFKHHRKLQDIYWLGETLKEKILNDFYSNEQMKNLLQEKENEVLNGEISSFQAADELYEKFQTN